MNKGGEIGMRMFREEDRSKYVLSATEVFDKEMIYVIYVFKSFMCWVKNGLKGNKNGVGRVVRRS